MPVTPPRKLVKKVAQKESTLLTPTMYKWWGLGILGLLFVMALVIHYKQPGKKLIDAVYRPMIDLGSSRDTSINRSSGRQVDAAMEGLASTDIGVRAQAMAGLMSSNADRGAEIMRSLLGDGQPAIRAQALRLLNEYHKPASAGIVVSLLMDADPEVRGEAATFLTNAPYDAGVLYQLGGPLGSSDPQVVSTALPVWQVYASHDLNSAAAAITPALRASDVGIVSSALSVIGAIPASNRGPFKGALGDVASRFGSENPGPLATSMMAEIP